MRLFFFISQYVIIQLMFAKTSQIGVFTKQEMLLLFGVATVAWALFKSSFFEGFKQMMIGLVKSGEFDQLMLKPINLTFYTAFRAPNLDGFIYLVPMLVFTFHQMILLRESFTVGSLVLFVIAFAIGQLVWFNVSATYSSLTFLTTQSSQVIRTLQTLSDHSMYPTNLYPRSIQSLFYSFVPNAVISFLPIMVLLRKWNWQALILSLAILMFTNVMRQLAWSFGLKRYSSASV